MFPGVQLDLHTSVSEAIWYNSRGDLGRHPVTVYTDINWYFVPSVVVVTCFLAYNSTFIPASQKLFGTIVVGIWVGIQLIWEFMFELRKCRQSGTLLYLNFSCCCHVPLIFWLKQHLFQKCPNTYIYITTNE